MNIRSLFIKNIKVQKYITYVKSKNIYQTYYNILQIGKIRSLLKNLDHIFSRLTF